MAEQHDRGAVEAVVQPLSILHFDVETSWMIVKTHSPKVEYIRSDQVVHRRFMHCWAAQWDHQKQILSDRQVSDEAIAKDDSRIAKSLASLVREADVVIGHNGNRFDIPKLRNRLVVHDLEPLGPVASIDTLTMARGLGFDHNNLDSLGIELGFGGKRKNPPGLWDDAYEGNEVALRKMVRYCRDDVALLANIFHRLRPHATQLRRLIDGEGAFCPYCGGTSYQKRGKVRTQASTVQQYQCNGCQRYFKDKTGDAAKRQMRPA
jgi:hypothetical protein